MADNTRVNELQDKLLQAMDILNAQALNSISFDKTITCTIKNDKDKKDGKYEVSDGNRIFAAYSTDTRLRTGDTVYVTVPEGKFENQKIIAGKKTAENDKPFNFTQPFDTFFDMTGNLIPDNISGSLLANEIIETDKTLENCSTQIQLIEKIDVRNQNIYGYSRLGIQADFCSWIKNAAVGNYGLLFVITAQVQNTVNEAPKKNTYTYFLDSSSMYGNPYNFETYYQQEVVLDLLPQEIGQIIDIELYFYQNCNFYDSYNNPIPYTEQGYNQPYSNSSKYARYDDNIIINDQGMIELKNSGNGPFVAIGNRLANNLFVRNINICFGYDISIFNNDFVQIYTLNKYTFRRSVNAIEDDTNSDNQKLIQTRWVHILNDIPTDMFRKKESELENYEIRWYRYHVGAAAADEYCGIYWERLQGNEFSMVFSPDVNKQQEKIKAIILQDGIPYHSNELIFENEETLPPSKEATYINNALLIKTDDGTNGNYMIYGQNNNIKESGQGDTVRTLSAYFDVDNDGKHESLISYTNSIGRIVWTFPTENTMITLLNGNAEGVVQNTQPQYKINSHYSPNKANNTVICEYTLNDVVYTTEKQFTFGKAGTMGTDHTLVVDFVGDKNAIVYGVDETCQLQVQVYDNQNELLTEVDNIEWKLLTTNGLSSNLTISQGVNEEIVTLNTESVTMNDLYIMKVSVGDISTYFPIPIKKSGVSHIIGPTEVIYGADGEPSYSKSTYELRPLSSGVTWNVICNKTDKDELKYIGKLENNKLKPLTIYVENAPVYGVQAKIGESIQWTQPILTIQNRWSSTMINEWDGKSLDLNSTKGSILAAAISAGRKNSDNTFSGVMIGDWSGTDSDSSITSQTGVYGFHKGAMSYALLEDGTAFFGKDGQGRIRINGDSSTLYSNGYKSNRGMKIDLDEPNIHLIRDNREISITIDNNKPYIELTGRSSSSLLLSVNDSKKPYLKMTGADSSKYIQMGVDSNPYLHFNYTGENKNDYPIAVGTRLKVDWSGTLNAIDGSFRGTVEADAGYLNNLDVNGKLSIAMNNNWSRTGPIYLYTYNKGQEMGYIGFVLGSDGESSTKNIGIKSSNNHGVVFESDTNARLSAKNAVYIDAQEIHFINCNASNQFGIYARFA